MKTVLVTGGTRGIGLSTALKFKEDGWNVYITSRKQENLDAVLKDHSNLKGFVARADDLSAATETCESIVSDTGSLDVLINNAAIDPKVTKDSGPGGAFETLSEQEWDLSVDVIMKGTFLCSQVFCPFFANKGGGVVINISSVMGVIAPNQSIYGESFKPITYSAAKHGIVGMTKYLATYYAQSNVRVNALSPGGVFDNHPDEFVDKLTNLIPMKRMADRNEYKGSIAFLCSDASSYMTGHNLIVDGGMSVW